MQWQINLGTKEQEARKLADADRVAARIRERDFTLWSPDPTEVANRLGWLDCPEEMAAHIEVLEEFAGELRQTGIKQVVLLGMGGSSLAAEVISQVYKKRSGIVFSILDTTDPAAIQALRDSLDLSSTVFIAATKSGSTIETLSLLCYFFEQCEQELGTSETNKHFICITDPGSSLPSAIERLEFRKCFFNDPDIGGRYSALSLFGLVPAAIMGVDINTMLKGAAETDLYQGAFAGVLLGLLATQGRNKLVVSCSETMKAFGAWLEQLVAESTGKQGKGILPVLDDCAEYPDGVRVRIQLAGEDNPPAAGNWDICCTLSDEDELGSLFYAWEVITAAACHVLGINAFDQPDVEMAKAFAKEVMSSPDQADPARQAVLETSAFRISSNLGGNDGESVLASLLKKAAPGGYVALLEFLSPNNSSTELVNQIGSAIQMATGVPVTLGTGPRYLHSTGQLHKGGFGGGVFIILESDPAADFPIVSGPGFPVSKGTFGELRAAQAKGDFQALVHSGRAAAHLRFTRELAGLKAVLDAVNSFGE